MQSTFFVVCGIFLFATAMATASVDLRDDLLTSAQLPSNKAIHKKEQKQAQYNLGVGIIHGNVKRQRPANLISIDRIQLDCHSRQFSDTGSEGERESCI